MSGACLGGQGVQHYGSTVENNEMHFWTSEHNVPLKIVFSFKTTLVCMVFLKFLFPFKLPLAINYWPVKWELGTGWRSDPDLMWPWANGWPFLIWADQPAQNSRVGNAFCKRLKWFFKKKNSLIICHMFTVHIYFCSWKAHELSKEKDRIFPSCEVWLPEGHAQWIPNCFLWVNWHLSPSPNIEKKTPNKQNSFQNQCRESPKIDSRISG